MAVKARSTQEHSLSTPPTNFITLSTNSAATRVYFSWGIKPAYVTCTTGKSRPTVAHQEQFQTNTILLPGKVFVFVIPGGRRVTHKSPSRSLIVCNLIL